MQWAGWSSDVWGSYLIVADPGTGDTLYQVHTAAICIKRIQKEIVF